MPAGISKNPHGLGQIVADEVHARVHMGQFFSASYIDLTFTNAEVADLVLVFGGITHIQFDAGAGNDALFQAYQGPAYSGGTPVVPQNHNRLSSLVSQNSLLTLPTVTDPGTLIENWVTYGGSGGRALGGSAGTFNEWIVPAGSFLFRCTNLTTNSGVLHVHFSWYEPTLVV